MPDPLFEAKGESVTSGLHPGTGNTQIPLWEKGTNIVFKDGSVKPGPQQSLVYNKPAGLLGNGVRSIDNQGSPALVWGNRRALYRGTAVPTANVATRANTLIDALDNDSGNWTGVATTMADETTIVCPANSSTDSLRFESTAVAHMTGYKTIAEDLTDKTFSIWLRVDAAVFALLSPAGDAIRIKFSEGANDDEYYLSAALIPAADTWVNILLDLIIETPDASTGVPDYASIDEVQLKLELSGAAGVADLCYWDEMEIYGAYSGTDLDRWSIVQFGQSVLATNGVDEVQYLADITTGLFVNLSDAGGDLASSFRAKIIHKLGPFIIAFNTDNDDTEARWCTEDNVLVWNPFPENSARDINLRDMNSSIKAVVEFGNALIVVGSTRAHIFQFIGPPLFFGAQKLIDGIGAVGKNALTEGGRLIFGFSAHGIYLTDGSTKQYIDEPDIHSFIFEGDNKYDKTRAELVCMWEDANDDEIYCSYPTIDGSGFTVSFNPKLQVWSMHNYWRTAASPGELFDAPILLAQTGDIWIQSDGGSGSSFDVNPLGLSDQAVISFGYGFPGYGEAPYGGLLEMG